MTSTASRDELEAEVRYQRERLALLRAKTYRGAPTSMAKLRELERALQSAEKRLAAGTAPDTA